MAYESINTYHSHRMFYKGKKSVAELKTEQHFKVYGITSKENDRKVPARFYLEAHIINDGRNTSLKETTQLFMFYIKGENVHRAGYTIMNITIQKNPRKAQFCLSADGTLKNTGITYKPMRVYSG